MALLGEASLLRSHKVEVDVSLFERDGFIILRNVLDPGLASELLTFVNAELDTVLMAVAAGELQQHEAFGATAPPAQAVANRWNMLMEMNDITRKSLGSILANSWEIFETLCGSDPMLCDLSALIANPGALRQTLHFDTRFSDADDSSDEEDHTILDYCNIIPENKSDATPTGRMDSPRCILPQDIKLPPVCCSRHDISGDADGLTERARQDEDQSGEVVECHDTTVPICGQGLRDFKPGGRCGKQKRLISAFVALQDVNEFMGPTLIVPGTNTAIVHEEVLAAQGPAERHEILGRYEALPGVVKCTLKKGDAVLLDSRALHLGSANVSEHRRVLFDFAFMGQRSEPSTYCECIKTELQSKFPLRTFREWTKCNPATVKVA
eukprot:gene24867-30307_t